MHKSFRRILQIEVLLFLSAFFLRTHSIAYPSSCVFDEMHYARFIGMYFAKEPVIDVHPPLGRLIVFYFVKYLSGSRYSKEAELHLMEMHVGSCFDGSLLEGVYSILRLLSSLAGTITVVAAYKTLCALQVEKNRALLLSLLFIFEGSMFTLFRTFMVDSYALLFISLSLLCLVEMNRASLSCFTSVRKSLILSAYLGVVLGAGVSLKWTVLPVGIPTAFFLLVDLRRKTISKKKRAFWYIPVAQGAISFFLMSAIYFLVFLINFQEQNTYAHKNSEWNSLRYIASLKGNPYENIKIRNVHPGVSISICAVTENLFINVTNARDQEEIVLSSTPEYIWSVSVIGSSFNSNFNRSGVIPAAKEIPVHIKIKDREYYLSPGKNIISSVPSIVYLCTSADSAYISNGKGERLCVQRRNIFWGRIATPLLLLAAPDTKPDTKDGNLVDYTHTTNNTTNTTINQIKTHKIKPYNVFSKFAEMNMVMIRCNRLVSSTHKYMSRPFEWLHPVKHIHMWNGNTSEVPSYNRKYGSSAQIFLAGNPINWLLSTVCIFSFCIYLLTTRTNQDTAYFLLLLSYLSNYLPYFFLSRDTYLHHYMPSYYFSILSLCIALSYLPFYFSFLTVGVSCTLFSLQYPILAGTPISYEAAQVIQIACAVPWSKPFFMDTLDCLMG